MTATTTGPAVTAGATDNSAAVRGAVETVESHLHPTPSWRVDDHPMPNGREEIWRFTPLKRFQTLLSEQAATSNLEWSGEHPDVSISRITPDQARELAVEAPVDRIAALAAVSDDAPVHIDVPAGVELSEAAVFTGTGKGGEARDRFVITVGANARATIVLRYQGQASYAEKVDIVVGDGANANIVTLQEWADGSVHGGQRSIRVGRDATVRAVTVSLGGDIRLQEDSRFAGPGGSLDQFGLYFVDAGQHIEHRLFVDHNEPRTHSNVDYRGALQGEGAHSVWIGDVLIRKVAEDISTYEANKNLVLTDGCRADSVPNLEIETGEIAGAGHSSTTGRFDDQQLFYLRSRGISEEEARRLVVRGFFASIIGKIGVPAIEERLLEAVEAELEKSVQQ